MANFAKLFQINPMNQVLVTIVYNPVLQKDVITQFTVIAGFDLILDVEFNEEDNANTEFDNYDIEAATSFYDKMVEFLERRHQPPPDDRITA